MPTIAGLMEWGASFGEIFRTPATREGFICGLAVGFILPVGILFVWWIVMHRRRRCRAVTIPGDGGDLVISSVAVREFIQRIVADFHELELLGVRLQRRKRATDIRIRVNAVPGANIKLLKEALKDQVRSEAEEKMGLDESLGNVHVDVQKYSASERAIEKKARKTARREPASTPSTPALYPYGMDQEPDAQEPEGKAEKKPSPGGKTADKNSPGDTEGDDTVNLC